MLFSQEIELGVLILVTFIYAIFDVFNKRNVPNAFAYFTIVVGVAVVLLFSRGFVLLITIAVAVIVGLLGYVFFRSGLLGGGDVLEFVFIALVMPLQIEPFYSSNYQWNIPFILSVIIAAGYTAMIFIPVYYLGIKKSPKNVGGPNTKKLRSGLLFFSAYLIFIIVMELTYGISLLGVALILLLALASAIVIVYEQRVYFSMVDFIYPSKLEDGDMIATNLMDKKDIAYFKKRTAFGRLASKKLISDIKNVRKKLPVYRDSVPFSLFIFLGVIISLLFGNLVLAIIGI